MKTEQIKLSQVKTNAANPRTITSDKFNKLVNSILVFPKMLELRPVVVDNKMVALGGNMRSNALAAISKMTPEQIAARLSSIADFQGKNKGERDALIAWWGKWLEAPFAYIIKATELTEDERQQFIIKDNVSFGNWDYDMLANKFDSKKLDDWALDVWNAAPIAFGSQLHGATNATSGHEQSVTDEEDDTIKLDAFFNEENSIEPKQPKLVYCPHCGKNINEKLSSENKREDETRSDNL